MKTRDLDNIRTKSVSELLKIAADKKNEAVQLSAKIKAGQEKNTTQAANLKRDIAQILTVVREKEIAAKIQSEKGVKSEPTEK